MGMMLEDETQMGRKKLQLKLNLKSKNPRPAIWKGVFSIKA
jgi:hypothetical protein